MERLLISTYNKLILWDGKAHTIFSERSHPDYRNFYGITWNEQEIIVAEGGRVNHSIFHLFDNSLKRVGALPLGKNIRDPHQIYWYDDRLYITSSWQDSVFIWAEKTRQQPAAWKQPGEPTLHLNSMWSDGVFFYVVEHRKREMPKRIMVMTMDFEPIRRIKIPAEGFVKAKPHGIHNVYVEGDFLYTCSPKAFVQFNMVTGKAEPIVPTPLMNESHYVRGLARVPGRWFVGLSEARVRTERGKGDSAILVLKDDFTVDDVIPLEDTGGLNDIRAIDGLDLAHNRIECPYGRDV